jgi:acyl-CoA thioester hydrolase
MDDLLARPDRSDFAVFRSVTTRWSDNDVYGHVNNVVHYSWFDTVVNALLIERGLVAVTGESPIFVVAETGCRYFASLAYPQTVEVGLAVARLGGRSITWRLGVFAAGGSEAASAGRFVHVCVDRRSRRPVAIPDDIRTVLERL